MEPRDERKTNPASGAAAKHALAERAMRCRDRCALGSPERDAALPHSGWKTALDVSLRRQGQRPLLSSPQSPRRPDADQLRSQGSPLAPRPLVLLEDRQRRELLGVGAAEKAGRKGLGSQR